jgi:CheY-like chemotaxis protein
VMHGLEVLRHLKSDPKHASIPVVILSARSRAKDLEAGKEAGAVEYVTKPFGMNELLAIISRNLAPTAVQGSAGR